MTRVRNLLAGCGALALAAGMVFGEPQAGEFGQERMAIGAFGAVPSNPDLNGLVGVERSAVCRLEVPMTMDAPFEVAIPVDDDRFTVRVEMHSVRSQGYQVRVQLADGSFVNAEPGPVLTFRGEILEIPGSTVAGSLVDGGVMMRMRLPDGNEWWVESITGRVPGAQAGDHVVYHRDDALPSGGVCSTPEGIMEHDQPADVGLHGTACGGLCIAQLGCDADVEYFNDFGSIAAVENRINSIVNTMNLDYEAEVQIRHEISGIVVRTAEPDPYTSTNSNTLVGQVRTEWLNNQDAIEHDLAHLFTGKEVDGSTIGQAFTIAGICTSSAYAYSQAECCGSTACAVDLVTHEIGHLWGGIHVGDPSCFMVTPLSCTATQFCASNISEITSHRDSRACLTGAENGTTTIPFSDTFPSTTIDAAKWTGIQGASSNSLGSNEPSSPNSLNIDGSDQIRSAIMDASSFNNLVLGYKKQVRGTQDSPETGDDLIIEIFDNTDTWVEVGRHLGSLADESTYTTHSINLSSNAQHDGLRIRFRGVSTTAGSDDWFVDDVTLTGNAVVPGPFNLLSPANNATNVSLNPPFDWSDSANATSYNFQLDDNADFSSPLFNLNRTVSNVTFGADFLNPGQTYYWKATASNSNGTINSTPVSHTFTTLGGGSNPEVRVTRGTTEIFDGGSYNYGSTSVGVPVERTYTVFNDGTATMTLGTLTVPAGYTVTKALPASLNAGASATFKIRFDAPSNGTFAGTAQFTNNDGDENPFNWNVTGIAAGPPIARVTKGASTTVANGGSDGFGSTPVGTPKARTYRLNNDGGTALNGSNLTVPAGFSITKAIPTNIGSGAFKTFAIQLDAIAPGSYSGPLSFNTNDTTNNPYTFTVSGTVTGSLFATGGQFGANGASKMAASGQFAGTAFADLIAVSANGGLVILAGDGSSQFTSAGEITLNGTPAGVTVGDFNNDSNNDIAYLTASSISIRLGNGNATLREAQTFSLPGTASALVAQDLTADARTDLLVADESGAISLFTGAGDGTFTGGVIANLDRPASAIAALHLNADNRPDFAVAASAGGHLSFFVSTESGTYERSGFVNVAGKVTALHAGNFDGDANADLVAISDTGAAIFVQGNDSGIPAVASSFTTPDADTSSVARDLNADGISDLVLTDRANNAVVVRLGNEGGEFAQPINLDVGFVPSSIAAGDFNADGGLDLAVFEVGGTSLRVLNNLNPWALCGGDATGDLRVDMNDLQVVLTNYAKVGVTRAQGDVDGDTDVDFDDLTGVLSAFGNACE